MTEKWAYTGDMDIENGGVFFVMQEGQESVRAIQVMKGSAFDDLQDGSFVILDGIISKRADIKEALSTCGYDLIDGSRDLPAVIDCTGAVSRGDDAVVMVTDSYFAYGGVQDGMAEVVMPEDIDGSLEDFVRNKFPELVDARGAPDAFASDYDNRPSGPQM